MRTIKQWADENDYYALEWPEGQWLRFREDIGIETRKGRRKVHQDRYGMDAYIVERIGGKEYWYYIRYYNLDGKEIYNFFKDK